MSSPPYSLATPSLGNPRKRPSIITTPLPQSKRRKASVAPSATSSAHPLRQTSFPPPEAQSFSPNSRQASFSPAVGTDIISTTSKSKKSKRKSKVASSTVNGDAASSAPGAPSTRGGTRGGTATAANAEDADDDDDEDDDFDLLDGAKEMNAAESKKQSEYRAILYEKLTKDQETRFNTWNRISLKKATVRKIANQTVSQSVPQSIVLTIGICAKVFLGDLIEGARTVQEEWKASAERLPTGELKARIIEESRKKRESNAQSRTQNAQTKSEGGAEDIKMEPSSPNGVLDSVEVDGEGKEEDGVNPFFEVEEMDKGPLAPDHIREALRRYKRDREGGGAGLQGMSLHGREVAAARTGGRRIFR